MDGIPEQMVLGIRIAGGEGVSVGLLVAIFVSNLPEAIGASATSGDFQAAIDGFAAGALLVMLIDSMIPEASRNAGDQAGLVTVLGFAVAAALSAVT